MKLIEATDKSYSNTSKGNQCYVCSKKNSKQIINKPGKYLCGSKECRDIMKSHESLRRQGPWCVWLRNNNRRLWIKLLLVDASRRELHCLINEKFSTHYNSLVGYAHNMSIESISNKWRETHA